MGGGVQTRAQTGRGRRFGSCVLFPGPLAWLLFSKTNGRKSALLEIKLGNCILHPFEKTRLFSFSLFFRSISLTPLFRPSRANSLKDFSLFLLRPLCFSPSRLPLLCQPSPLPPPSRLRVYLFTILTASFLAIHLHYIESSCRPLLLRLINPS